MVQDLHCKTHACYDWYAYCRGEYCITLSHGTYIACSGAEVLKMCVSKWENAWTTTASHHRLYNYCTRITKYLYSLFTYCLCSRRIWEWEHAQTCRLSLHMSRYTHFIQAVLSGSTKPQDLQLTVRYLSQCEFTNIVNDTHSLHCISGARRRFLLSHSL